MSYSDKVEIKEERLSPSLCASWSDKITVKEERKDLTFSNQDEIEIIRIEDSDEENEYLQQESIIEIEQKILWFSSLRGI